MSVTYTTGEADFGGLSCAPETLSLWQLARRVVRHEVAGDSQLGRKQPVKGSYPDDVDAIRGGIREK